MELADIKKATPAFTTKAHAEKIKIFAWYLHTQRQKSYFQPADIKACYNSLHLVPPQSFGGYFKNLVRSKELLKNTSGYCLSARARDPLDSAYTPANHNVQVKQLLLDLPDKVQDLVERTYLEEAIICYKNGAFRAAVVMTWNLAYDHLCNRIIKNSLAAFNARWRISYPGHHKHGAREISSIDDFNGELKESEVVAICRDAKIITKDVYRILEEKLGRRNSAAHPSSVIIGQLQVDAFIDDLVNNVVIKIK